MKSTSKVSVKKLDRTTYRVSSANGRSAMTGRFVSATTVERAPRTSVSEQRTVKDSSAP
ncbi:hypothetical protein [Cellulomonas triticagri]|uniref:hypothetical protein n=1 Tax=Cellulomonas triticagri TaxID=2483352 RepID=UPI0013153F93|nr:hypothetical protein [Cellulomonas triticagri]